MEQQSHWRVGRKSAPGFAEQCRQMAEARAENAWLAAGSSMVQQQALRDFAQAMANFFPGTHAPGRNVKQKAGLNRGILTAGWGQLARRLEDKAPGRVVKIGAAYTSQTCSECGRVDADSRKSQAEFVCTGCGHTRHADVNAACNIRDRALWRARKTAAGRAVAARGGGPEGQPVNREPQLVRTSW